MLITLVLMKTFLEHIQIKVSTKVYMSIFPQKKKVYTSIAAVVEWAFETCGALMYLKHVVSNILPQVCVGSILFSLCSTNNQCFSLLVFVSIHKVFLPSFLLFFFSLLQKIHSRFLSQHPYPLHVIVRGLSFCNQFGVRRGTYLCYSKWFCSVYLEFTD